MKKFYILLLITLVNFKLKGATYYVSNTGNDSYTNIQAQNISTPWKTIAKINSIMNSLQPGDSILFKAGEVFYGELNITVSGNSLVPLVFSSYGIGQKPEITGFEEINSWNYIGNGIYESNVLTTNEVRIVSINNKLYPIGRHPNIEDINKGYLTYSNSGSSWIESNSNSSTINWTGAEVVLRKNRWIIDKAIVTSHSGLNLNFLNPTSYIPTNGFGYFIQKDLRTLDKFGEWYFNDTTQKLNIYFGSTPPNSFIIKASTAENIIHSTGSYLTFSNLKISGSNNHLFLSDGAPKNNYLIDSCEFSFAGKDAFWMFQLNNCTIQNTIINHINNNGIGFYYGCQNTTIKNNLLENVGCYPGMGESGDLQYIGIFTREANSIISENIIKKVGYNAIHFDNHSNLITKNFIDSFCLLKDDGAAIYTYDGASNGLYPKNIINFNTILNGIGAIEGSNTSHGDATGIYLDDNSDFTDVVNNNIASCSNSGIFLHNSRNILIRDNVVYDCPKSLYTKNDSYGPNVQNNEIKSNLFFCKEKEDLAGYFKSDYNDISLIGNFDSNFYVRPFDTNLIITEEHFRSDLNSKIMESYNLTDWSSKYSIDNLSKNSPLHIPYYSILSLDSNRINNGNFNTGISSTYLWSPNSDHSTFWNTTMLDGGCFELHTPTYAHTGFTIDSVADTNFYIVRFSAKSNKKGTIQTQVWMSSNPWLPISSVSPVKTDTNRTDFEILYKNIDKQQNASLMFKTGVENFIYYLDNIEFRKANIQITHPDSVFLFLYNHDSISKTVSLSNNYMDVSGNLISGSINIPKYSSTVLIKQGSTTEIKNLITKHNKLKIFPNPAQSKISLIIEGYKKDEKQTLNILTLNGKILYSKVINNLQTEIDLPSLKSGLYLVKLLNNNNEIIGIEKLIITANH